MNLTEKKYRTVMLNAILNEIVQINRFIEMHLTKWSFVFLQENTKFHSCTKAVIYFFIAKYEFF